MGKGKKGGKNIFVYFIPYKSHGNNPSAKKKYITIFKDTYGIIRTPWSFEWGGECICMGKEGVGMVFEIFLGD